MSRANALVAKVRRLDAAMSETLGKVGDLAAQRRMAVAELYDVLLDGEHGRTASRAAIEKTAEMLGISPSSIYKALRGV